MPNKIKNNTILGRGTKLKLLVNKSRESINGESLEPHNAGDVLIVYCDYGGWPKRVNAFSRISPYLSDIVYLWDGDFEICNN